MASKLHSRQQILSEAFTQRAEAYRRWRDAAAQEKSPAVREVYHELAALECDRFEQLASRFYQPSTAPPSATGPSALGRPDWVPPAGGRNALRAAADAAEAERKTWADRLRRAGDHAPERRLLEALLDDASRACNLVGSDSRNTRRA